MIADFFEKPQSSPSPRLVPVIAIEEAAEAIPLGRTLLENGLPIAEITFRTKAAGAAISQLATLSDLMLGAGTVLSTGQVQEAFDAGAQFMVTPGFNPKVVEYCIKKRSRLYRESAPRRKSRPRSNTVWMFSNFSRPRAWAASKASKPSAVRIQR